MVETFGNNIIDAYTGGVQVIEIYSNGVKVWPVSPSPIYPNNEIHYRSNQNSIITPYDTTAFGANIVSNTYSGTGSSGEGVITFDGPVTRIGYRAFYDNNWLEYIVIPESVERIGQSAFEGVIWLNENSVLRIPASVTYIGTNAFFGACPFVSGIEVDSNNTVYDSRNNCNAIIRSSDNVLIQGCTRTVIPNTVTALGNYCFASMDLRSITIPSSVTSIGEKAFYFNDDYLTTIVIPSSVTSIGDYAFSDCEKLRYVTVNAVVPPTIGVYSYIFDGCHSSLQIRVPASSLTDYQTATGWSTYASYIVAQS